MRLRWGGLHLLRVFAIDQQQVRHKIAAIPTVTSGCAEGTMVTRIRPVALLLAGVRGVPVSDYHTD